METCLCLSFVSPGQGGIACKQTQTSTLNGLLARMAAGQYPPSWTCHRYTGIQAYRECSALEDWYRQVNANYRSGVLFIAVSHYIATQSHRNSSFRVESHYVAWRCIRLVTSHLVTPHHNFWLRMHIHARICTHACHACAYWSLCIGACTIRCDA